MMWLRFFDVRLPVIVKQVGFPGPAETSDADGATTSCS